MDNFGLLYLGQIKKWVSEFRKEGSLKKTSFKFLKTDAPEPPRYLVYKYFGSASSGLFRSLSLILINFSICRFSLFFISLLQTSANNSTGCHYSKITGKSAYLF